MIQFNESHIEQIEQMAENGATIRDMAKRMYVSTMKIQSVIKDRGIKTKFARASWKAKDKPEPSEFFNWKEYGEEGIKMFV